MKFELDKNFNPNKTALGLSALSVLFAILAFLSFPVGFLFLPLVSAFYGAVIVIERGSKLRFTFITPAVLLIFEILFCGLYSLNSLFSIAVGAVCAYLFVKGKSKAECSVYISILCILLLVVSLFLYLFFVTKSVSLSASLDYLKTEYEEFRETFINAFIEVSSESEVGNYAEGITEDTVALLFDNFYFMIPSLFATVAFLLAGITLKVFSSVLMKRSCEPEIFLNWRFLPTPLFAYAYAVSVILSFLAGGSTDIIALLVSNFLNILMPVFLYLGLQFVFAFMRQRHTAFMSVFILVFAAMLFGGVFFEILSYVGVFFTIIFHKANKKFSI